MGHESPVKVLLPRTPAALAVRGNRHGLLLSLRHLHRPAPGHQDVRPVPPRLAARRTRPRRPRTPRAAPAVRSPMTTPAAVPFRAGAAPGETPAAAHQLAAHPALALPGVVLMADCSEFQFDIA